jgi:hypothetical protein
MFVMKPNFEIRILFHFRPDRVVHSHEDDETVRRPASSLELQNLRSLSGKENLFTKSQKKTTFVKKTDQFFLENSLGLN